MSLWSHLVVLHHSDECHDPPPAEEVPLQLEEVVEGQLRDGRPGHHLQVQPEEQHDQHSPILMLLLSM